MWSSSLDRLQGGASRGRFAACARQSTARGGASPPAGGIRPRPLLRCLARTATCPGRRRRCGAGASGARCGPAAARVGAHERSRGPSGLPRGRPSAPCASRSDGVRPTDVATSGAVFALPCNEWLCSPLGTVEGGAGPGLACIGLERPQKLQQGAAPPIGERAKALPCPLRFSAVVEDRGLQGACAAVMKKALAVGQPP